MLQNSAMFHEKLNKKTPETESEFFLQHALSNKPHLPARLLHKKSTQLVYWHLPVY